MVEVPPHIIAQADQELATTDTLLPKLVDRWLEVQPFYDAWELDRVRRVSVFMAAELFPLKRLAWAMLVVAIEKLATEGGS